MNNNVKSATTAGLLGIFLGAIGAHDWYLGNKTKGIIHVCLAASGIILMIVADALLPAVLSWRSLVTFAWLFTILNALASLVMFGNGVWGFVEGIIILTQGDAGLARKGYAVANNNFGQNNFNNGNNFNQPMNNMNGGYNNGNQGEGQQNGMQQGNSMQNGVSQNGGQQNEGMNQNQMNEQNVAMQNTDAQNGAAQSEVMQSEKTQDEAKQGEVVQDTAGEENGK